MTWDDDIHNVYEKLVVEYVEGLEMEKNYDHDFIADMCCVVLNKLPSRYIRHDVDMQFYLTDSEREEMQERVAHAVNAALVQLKNKQNRAE